ncbi:MAG: 50S ribosomal protein L37ae [Candidatus Aenigmatarchaeota archaeon]
MGRTKKVGTTGRFGARYGGKIKEAVREIEKVQKQKHQCPSCKKNAVKRVAAGIWKCKKCGTKFAGGAFVPTKEVVA